MNKMNKNSGFTLVEVLIAMLILAVGLLGVAGLQATGLRNNLSAYNRSQATQLAYDMADRMRANVADADTLDESVYITTDLEGTLVEQSACLEDPGCDSDVMAVQDLFKWKSNLATILPSGEGLIEVNGNLFTITVNWDDNRDGSINDDDPNFEMSFQL